MSTQIRVAVCLRVHIQARFVLKRFFPVCAAALTVLVIAPAVCAAPQTVEDYDVIIEKNLFHNQRQKWEMEKSPTKGASSQAGQKDRGDIDKINLFGTVIKDSQSYAVMRVSQTAAGRATSRRTQRRGSRAKDREQPGARGSIQSQDTKQPYAVGDFISGYQVAEIRSESVLLQDPYDNKRYEIFMNDGQTERTAERTEIAEDKPKLKKSPQARKDPHTSKKPSPDSKKTDALRKRFERDLKLMREKRTDAVERQAERNWQRLEPMMNSLGEKDQEELERLKSEFEKLRK